MVLLAEVVVFPSDRNGAGDVVAGDNLLETSRYAINLFLFCKTLENFQWRYIQLYESLYNAIVEFIIVFFFIILKGKVVRRPAVSCGLQVECH